MLICGSMRALGLAGVVPAAIAFAVFTLGRTLYGAWGSASPPAVPAYVAARPSGGQESHALARPPRAARPAPRAPPAARALRRLGPRLAPRGPGLCRRAHQRRAADQRARRHRLL